MTNEQRAKRVYELATTLWFKLVNTPGGHPGPQGPAGPGGPPWDMTQAHLGGAIAALEQVLTHLETAAKTDEIPDPIKVLHDLFEAGRLEDHFYAIKESEGGWDGPRMLAWGIACQDAAKLLKDYKA